MFPNKGMFTGIVEEIGAVKTIGTNSITIQGNIVLENTRLGDSIAVNGACLTVIELTKSSFSVEIMPETKRLTNIGNLHTGEGVNLERAMPVAGRFGGHFVQGHVDAVGKVVSQAADGKAIILSITAPEEITRYLVNKCFVAVNGVSLTVIDCKASQFSVSLVGYTMQNTNLGKIKQGAPVNLEIDIIAKYIEKFYQPNKEKGMNNLLEQYDYLKAR
jgi:riboflavin synthase